MKQVNGAWIPDDDHHLTEMLFRAARMDDFPLYQHDKLANSLRFVKQWGSAIDVGANVGLWCRWLAEKFGQLHCFEPIHANLQCLNVNLPFHMARVHLHAFPVGERTGLVGMAAPPDIGPVGFHVEGVGPFEMRRLDDLLDSLGPVGYLKVDTCGSELQVLEGAHKLLALHRPVVVVDVKHKSDREPVVELLLAHGAALEMDMSGVLLFSWRQPRTTTSSRAR